MYDENIRALRQRLGYSQQTLGEMVNVSSVSVGKWERGQTQPGIETLARLADIFGVSMDELCGHEPPAPPAPDGNITVMTRAFRQLTPEEQEKYIAVGKALFAHAFADPDRRL